jgi:hypothetical protein
MLFLIQSHKDPDQLARLVGTLRKGCPDSVVLVSHDVHATPLPRRVFGGDTNVHVIQGKGGRGDFTIVDGYLAALRWLRDNRIHYTWITNLSGQDYPVSSLAAFAEELSAAPHDGFLHHSTELAQDPRDGYDRYYFQYRKLKNSLSLAERAMLRLPRVALERFSAPYRINTSYGLMIGRRAHPSPFNAEFRCYAGSYWHTIRRRCAEYLLDFVDAKPDLVAYLQRVLVPDECFFQTVLANHPGFRFVNDNRRYFDMRGARHGHPKVMTEDDLPKFLGGRYFFARKFERSNGLALLDRLDQYALGGTAGEASAGRVTPRAVAAAQAY